MSARKVPKGTHYGNIIKLCGKLKLLQHEWAAARQDIMHCSWGVPHALPEG